MNLLTVEFWKGDQTGGALPPPPWEAQAAESSPVAGSPYPSPMQMAQVMVTHSQPMQTGMYPQGPRPAGNDQVVGMYFQPITSGQLSSINNQMVPSPQIGIHPPPQLQGQQYMGMLPQQMNAGPMYPQQMYGNQMAGMAGYGAYGAYGQQQSSPYLEQQNTQYLEQQMYGLSVRDENGYRNSPYQVSTSSYGTPMNKAAAKPEDKLFGDLVDMAKIKPSKPTTSGRAGSMWYLSVAFSTKFFFFLFFI